ncbi:MAG: hypothetical protein HY834_12385 [Devosia nanyangense]|uniref:Uncharacterized protein n=1 Tax=Devosia nanyangense TaxID=1228055 RepID=A0A933NZB3_9HYPH|nr:hypothetical protein [Devosia nanyangense]
MSQRIFLLFAAAAYAILGAGLLLVPALVMAPFGVSLDAPGEVMTRILGGGLVSVALLFWWVRDSTDTTTRAIIRSQAISNLVGIVALGSAIAAGIVDLAGLMPLALHVVLGIGFWVIGFGWSAARAPG